MAARTAISPLGDTVDNLSSGMCRSRTGLVTGTFIRLTTVRGAVADAGQMPLPVCRRSDCTGRRHVQRGETGIR